VDFLVVTLEVLFVVAEGLLEGADILFLMARGVDCSGGNQWKVPKQQYTTKQPTTTTNNNQHQQPNNQEQPNNNNNNQTTTTTKQQQQQQQPNNNNKQPNNQQTTTQNKKNKTKVKQIGTLFTVADMEVVNGEVGADLLTLFWFFTTGYSHIWVKYFSCSVPNWSQFLWS
jgi:preprotein translocase subunit SecF